MERPGTETTRDYRNEKSEEGNGTSNFNKDEDARLDGMERMMVEQNRMLSEILELLLVQHECREAHREKTVPSRLKKTSFASVKNDENRRAESEVEPKRKKPSSLRKQVIAKQQQQEKIHGDSLKERKAQFALKTLRVENDEKRVRSSTALAVEAAKRDMSRQTAAKLQEDQSDGNINNSVTSWIVTLLIVLAGIGAFGLGIVAVLVKDLKPPEDTLREGEL